MSPTVTQCWIVASAVLLVLLWIGWIYQVQAKHRSEFSAFAWICGNKRLTSWQQCVAIVGLMRLYAIVLATSSSSESRMWWRICMSKYYALQTEAIFWSNCRLLSSTMLRLSTAMEVLIIKSETVTNARSSTRLCSQLAVICMISGFFKLSNSQFGDCLR